jgi:hypothetical protein
LSWKFDLSCNFSWDLFFFFFFSWLKGDYFMNSLLAPKELLYTRKLLREREREREKHMTNNKRRSACAIEEQSV